MSQHVALSATRARSSMALAVVAAAETARLTPLEVEGGGEGEGEGEEEEKTWTRFFGGGMEKPFGDLLRFFHTGMRGMPAP